MPEKVLCRRAEVVKDFRHCTTDCVFCTVIGVKKILYRKPKESAERHQTLSSRVGYEARVGSGYKTNNTVVFIMQELSFVIICNLEWQS